MKVVVMVAWSAVVHKDRKRVAESENIRKNEVESTPGIRASIQDYTEGG